MQRRTLCSAEEVRHHTVISVKRVVGLTAEYIMIGSLHSAKNGKTEWKEVTKGALKTTM